MRAITLILLALLAPGLSAATGGLASSKSLGYVVSDYRDAEGRQWIYVKAEYEALYREGMEDLIAVLWDFPGSPKVFSRIEAVRVRSEGPGVAVTEQRTGVRVLGLAFISNLVFANRVERIGSKAAKVSFESIETDGSCLSSKGLWSFEDASGPGGKATLARFTLESYVEPRFIGQAAIMRGFGAADVGRVLRELGAATAKRRSGG